MRKKTKNNSSINHGFKRLTLRAIVCSFVLSFIFSAGFAQLKVYPLPNSGPQKVVSKQKNKAARTEQLTPRSLPFWDDFSWTQVDQQNDTLANYPLDSLWVNNYTVWINSGLGLNPPSINVATFNGLNAANQPYSDVLVSNGFRDTLVSQPIKLDEVPESERATVYLSFFYQWSGNGEPPDTKDYMRVDFKDSDGIWVPVMTIPTSDTFREDEFYDTLVQVTGERFFHEGFQFRFMNYGRMSGPYDTWNIDYVYLNKYRDADDRYLPDRSIISTPTNLFGDFRAVPYDHFLSSANDPVKQPSFDVFNVKNDTSTLSYYASAIFTNYTDSVGVTTVVDTLGNAGASPIDGVTGIIFQREKKTVTLQHLPDRSDPFQFDPEADYADVTLKLRLFTGDVINPKTGEFANDYNPNVYKPLDFRSNDTIRADYALRNYYAYDDGFAEYAVGLTAFGNRAAYLFEMLTDEPDTLIGFEIYYPDYGVIGTLTVDFTIYNDINGLPGTPLYTLPNYTLRKSGINKFDRIPFGEQFLVPKRFYIGWRAPVGGTFRVGLDTNNDSGSKLFVNTNGTWVQNTDVIGAVMIRPLFGIGQINVGITEEDPRSHIYPNPTEGTIFIPASYELIDITTVTGRAIRYGIHGQGEYNRIQLVDTAPGLYVVRIRKEGKLFSSKLVVR